MSLRSYLIVIFIFGMIQINAQINMNAEINTIQLQGNDNFPNNPDLPVLLYKNVFDFNGRDPASTIEKILARNNWGGSCPPWHWR